MRLLTPTSRVRLPVGELLNTSRVLSSILMAGASLITSWSVPLGLSRAYDQTKLITSWSVPLGLPRAYDQAKRLAGCLRLVYEPMSVLFSVCVASSGSDANWTSMAEGLNSLPLVLVCTRTDEHEPMKELAASPCMHTHRRGRTDESNREKKTNPEPLRV